MIEISKLTKSFLTPAGRHYVFRELDLSFPEDTSIGLIGPNGAGKSTLLGMLAGVDAPDSGTISTDKRISWPVGLSRGMQKSLSGRDNVKFVCRLLGATGALMREKVKYVQDFAQIGEYFDVQIANYSSGMRSRVAFGLSMAFDFDYYLIDEITAVGDAKFRNKCAEVIRARQEHSSLIMVSHNMVDIREWCDAVVLVADGTAQLYEDLEEGIRAYEGPPQPVRPQRAAYRARKQALRAAKAAAPEASAAAAASETQPTSP